MNTLLATLAAYLLGSLSFAVIVSRVMGLADPRSYGSKNPGATNVLRSGNKKAAAVTLLLDAFKGFLPVVLVKWFGPEYGLGAGTLAFVALAAFLGHLYPIFFKFKGGKGVATAAGVLLGISGWLGLFVLLLWIGTVLVSRYSSLGALMAALGAPLIYIAGRDLLWEMHRPVLLAIGAMCLLLVWRHHENINRLIAGKESKVGGKKKTTEPAVAAAGAKGKKKR